MIELMRPPARYADMSVTLLGAIALALAMSGLMGCTNMMPQYAAQQYAPSYYEGSYNTLAPQQKFQLEDHLSKQSNQAWQTTAQVMSGAGKLMGGTGSLLGAIHAFQKPGNRSHSFRIPRLAQR